MSSILYFIALAVGIVIGWAWCSIRVANVVRPHLTVDAADEELDMSEELFDAVTPRPISTWIDREAKRRTEARRGADQNDAERNEP